MNAIKLPVTATSSGIFVDAQGKWVQSDDVAAALNAADLRAKIEGTSDADVIDIFNAMSDACRKGLWPGAVASAGRAALIKLLASDSAKSPALNAAPTRAFEGLTVEALGEMLSEAGEEMGDPPHDLFARGAWLAAHDAALLSRLQAFDAPKPPATALQEPRNDLWAVHVLGPDDIHAAASHADALALCDELNAIGLQNNAGKTPGDQRYVIHIAYPMPWPYSPEAHAESLAQRQADEAEWAARKAAYEAKIKADAASQSAHASVATMPTAGTAET